ncbi:uncharacterized protein LOC143067753 [Mytilus galloprovincialis]|uniref:uncharacterized protein LOC143067753 n=1 Tax=Mytilus galloprovincialis TaxID=29158 RepID=UPI003F7BB582
MKRGRCFVNSIELNLPFSILKEITSKNEHEDVTSLFWKGQCFESDSSCIFSTQICENKFKVQIRNTNIALKGCKLSCTITDIESTEYLDWDCPEKTIKEKKQPIQADDGEIINHQGAAKRKRGRPKGTTKRLSLGKSLENDKTTLNAEVSHNSGIDNAPKKYGLRGVKLSQAVMRAEMGSAYKEKESDNTNKCSDIHEESKNLVQSGQAVETVDVSTNNEEILKTDVHVGEDENVVDDDKDADYIGNDYVGYISEDEEFEPVNIKRKFGSLVTKNRQRKRIKIDIGDVNIPKYKPKTRFFKNKGCKYCKKLFYHYIGVEEHVRKYHMKELDVQSYLEELKNLRIEKCEICNKTFNNRYHLIEHEKRTHLENASVKCFKCNKIYKNVQSLKNHIKAVHSVIGQPFACHLCAAKFKWSTTLKQHIEEIHEGKMKAVCKHCGKKFPRQNLLNRHMRIHGVDQSKRLCCKHCGRGFWYEHNLQRHVKIIHGPHEENFHCSYCGKGFNMKSAMVTHVQQVHFNIFPYRCIDCNVGFKRSKLYRLHMMKEHAVVDCNALKTNVRHFKYGKTEEDLFYCSHCSLSFCYKTKMVEHMHSAHGEDFPYMCTHCNQGFLEKSFLSHHLLMAHNEILPAGETQEEEKNRFQMVTIDINGQKKDLEVESFNLPQPVVIEKTEEVGNIVNVEIKENEILSEENGAQSLFFEVSKGADTIHYVIEQSANGDPTILPQELANLLLAAEQSLQGANEESTDDTQLLSHDHEVTDSTQIITVPSLKIDEVDCVEENV